MHKLHDPQTTSYGFTLRDLVYIIRSGFRIVERALQETKEFPLIELSETLMIETSNKIFCESPFKRNHSKQVIQLLFCAGLLGNKENI